MTDILILICCIIAGFLIGKYVEKKISERGVFYQELNLYVSLLKDNVTGRQLNLSDFNKRFAENCGKNFSDYLSTGKVTVRLSKIQRDNLSVFFNNLDCESSQALVDHINYYGKILSDDTQGVLKEVSKASIYSKLGILLGAMAGILFV